MQRFGESQRSSIDDLTTDDVATPEAARHRARPAPPFLYCHGDTIALEKAKVKRGPPCFALQQIDPPPHTKYSAMAQLAYRTAFSSAPGGQREAAPIRLGAKEI